MLTEQGKRLPTLRQYAQMLCPSNSEIDDWTINQYGAISDTNLDSVFAVQTSPHHFRLMPGSEFSPRLYRGQNCFYEPCVPSIYRGTTPIDVIYWTIKWLELNFTLNKHPACVWLRDIEIEGLKFGFNIMGIAQHYGFPTPLFDFSRSKDVAMFFALCRYDKETNAYHPLKSGTAVLYTIDLREILLAEGPSTPLPLGLEPLPRPESQRAFAVQFLPGENLNSKSWAKCQKFEITEKNSNKFFEMFEGGNTLFPSNPFDSYIQLLRDNGAIPRPMIEIGIERGWLPPHPAGLEAAAHELQSAGYEINEDQITVDPQTIASAKRDWQQRQANFLSKIRLRGIADHFQGL